jgi:cation:H+ antiporter
MLFLNFFLLIIGFVLLIKGADILVDGSSAIAKRFGISNIVIGLTVIAFGTSAPELIVNIIAAIKGSSDIGMGNIVGSNISNILLILGVAALFSSLKVESSIIKKQIPFSILASVALFILINSTLLNGSGQDGLMRSGGLILILFFCIFLYYTFSVVKKEVGFRDVIIRLFSFKLFRKISESNNGVVNKSSLKPVLMVVGGIIALFFGGKFIVDSAVFIAGNLGLSEALIGLTIVAVGTSLPELAASVIAARKKQADMAIGNVIGSNIFNILWVLGLTSLIRPINYNPAMNFDIIFLIIVSIVLLPLIFIGKKYHFTKKEGIFLLSLYVFYLIYIIIRG